MEGSGLQAPPESEPPRFPPQPVVQNLELSEKARVGADISVGLHRLDGIDQRHVLADHEEGQDNRGRAAYPHGAVDQHAVSGSVEGISDVSSNRQKVDTEVKEGIIISFNAIVLQRCSAIKLGTGVHLKLARSDIHNMSDAQLDKTILVSGSIRISQEKVGPDFIDVGQCGGPTDP